MSSNLAGIIVLLLVVAAIIGVNYLIIKAAVSAAIKETLWNAEISMRNAVKNGVQEALQEVEKNKSGGNNG